MNGRRAWALAIGVALTVVVLLALRPKPALGPLKRSYWFWHSPFSLSKDDLSELRSLGVETLFVRAGTFTQDGRIVTAVFPQTYGKGADSFPVHLVFNGDGGFVRHFGEFDRASLSDSMARAIESSVLRARRSGVHVVGVQLDIDCPTRLLGHYAKVARSLKGRLGKGLAFSVTGLTGWLGTKGVYELSREVDFMVPQAYEGQTGLSVGTVRPVFDPHELDRALRQADQLACPYWIGLPSYGRAFLFDDQDRLVGTYRGLEPQDAFDHPAFRYVDGYACDSRGRRLAARSEWSGERLLFFKAVREDAAGRGLGYSVVFTVPTPELTSIAEHAVRLRRGIKCLGSVFFEVPREGSSLSVPLQAVMAGFQGRRPRPDLVVDVTARRDAADVVDGAGHVPIDLVIKVSNVGQSQTAVDREAVSVVVDLERPGVDGVRLRDFDRARFWKKTFAGARECRPFEADRIEFTKRFMSFRETCEIGPVRLASEALPHVTIEWSAMDPSGFDRVHRKLAKVVPALVRTDP